MWKGKVRRRYASWLGGGLLCAVGIFVAIPELLPYRPPAKPLRIGVAPAPPFAIIRPGEEPSGYAVDTVREAARRLGMPLIWVPSTAEPREALIRGEVDLWSSLSDSGRDDRRVFISAPWRMNEYVLLLDGKRGEAETGQSAGGESRFRKVVPKFRIEESQVATNGSSAVRAAFAARHPGVRFFHTTDPLQAAARFCAGEADAALLDSRLILEFALRRPRGCEGWDLALASGEATTIGTGTAATNRAARHAVALRSEIGKMAEDGTLPVLHNRYFAGGGNDTPAFLAGAEAREQRHLAAGFGMALALVIAIMTWQNRRVSRARRKALAALEENGRLLAAAQLDIQHRREVETALRASQERFDLAMQATLSGVWDWDVRAGRIYWSPRYCEMLGYDFETVVPSYELWRDGLHAEDRQRGEETLASHIKNRTTFWIELRVRVRPGEYRWFLHRGQAVWDENGNPVRMAGSIMDTHAEKQASEERDRLNRELLDVSRQAGMAEVATGVLHNVGNVLNSVNVSVTLLGDRLRKSEVHDLVEVAKLIEPMAHDLRGFLESDPRGEHLGPYLVEAAHRLAEEQQGFQNELASLSRGVEHVKEIVAMQQSYARVSGVLQELSLAEVLEDALKINSGSADGFPYEVVREYQELPAFEMDKHQVIEILVNLISNAKHALRDSRRQGATLTLRLGPAAAGHAFVEVQDNGVGISAAVMERLFTHGFTTKQQGHGFGLHASILAARQLNGELTAESEGPGMGATFRLVLPLKNHRLQPGVAAGPREALEAIPSEATPV